MFNINELNTKSHNVLTNKFWVDFSLDSYQSGWSAGQNNLYPENPYNLDEDSQEDDYLTWEEGYMAGSNKANDRR